MPQRINLKQEVSYILYLIIITAVLLVLMALKYLRLKKEIRKLSAQVKNLSQGTTEKLLDLSLIDHDLEQLASLLNQQYMGERQAVAGALRHEEHLKDSIANLSHDLRTPLTVIMGHLQLLLSSPLTEEQKQRAETALRKSCRMKELIGAFYDLSVLDSQQIQPRWQRLNLSNLLTDFLAENAPLFLDRQIEPQIVLPKTSLYLRADRTMMERILQNLLGNAVRYTAGQIKITLSSTPDGSPFLQIDNTVKNPESIDPTRLFQRFYTGDHSRQSAGTGLGLAVVQLLTEKMNGTVSASLVSNHLTITLSF